MKFHVAIVSVLVGLAAAAPQEFVFPDDSRVSQPPAKAAPDNLVFPGEEPSAGHPGNNVFPPPGSAGTFPSLSTSSNRKPGTDKCNGVGKLVDGDCVLDSGKVCAFPVSGRHHVKRVGRGEQQL